MVQHYLRVRREYKINWIIVHIYDLTQNAADNNGMYKILYYGPCGGMCELTKYLFATQASQNIVVEVCLCDIFVIHKTMSSVLNACHIIRFPCSWHGQTHLKFSDEMRNNRNHVDKYLFPQHLLLLEMTRLDNIFTQP